MKTKPRADMTPEDVAQCLSEIVKAQMHVVAFAFAVREAAEKLIKASESLAASRAPWDVPGITRPQEDLP